MLLLDITIVNVALPDIQRALNSSFADLQWIVDAYALTLAAFLLTAGSLADMYGRRLLYLIGLAVFTCASVLCGFAANTLMLQISRAVQGVGGAIMFAVSLALLADAFRGKDRGTAFGVWGAVTGLAVAIGPLLGGVLTSGISWRWIFFVNAPIGVDRGRPHRHAGRRVARAARQPAGLAGLRAVHARAGQPDLRPDRVEPEVLHRQPRARLLRRRRGAADRVRASTELRTSHPMFDLALFRKPTFSGGSVAAFTLSASIFAMLLYLVLYLQDILGYSALGTGVRLMFMSGGILVAATIAGRLSSRVPVRFLIGPGLLIVGAALLLMRGLTATLELDAPDPRLDRRRHRRRAGEPAARVHRGGSGRRRSGRAWPRASTRRSGRSASRPGSRCSAPCSRTTCAIRSPAKVAAVPGLASHSAPDSRRHPVRPGRPRPAAACRPRCGPPWR